MSPFRLIYGDIPKNNLSQEQESIDSLFIEKNIRGLKIFKKKN